MKDNKSTKNFSDEEQFDSISGDSNTAQFYQEEDSRLEERNDGEDHYDDHNEAPKKSNKTKVIIGAAVVGVFAVAGGYLALSEDEPAPTPRVEKKVQTTEEVKVPKIDDAIKINEGLKEVPQPPAPINNEGNTIPPLVEHEKNEPFNIEPPKVEEQPNIFKDVEKPVETVNPVIPSVGSVEPLLNNPVIDQPIEMPKVEGEKIDTPIIDVAPKVEDKPIIAEITPPVSQPEVSIDATETIEDLTIPTQNSQNQPIGGNTLIEPNFEEEVKFSNNDESMAVLIKELSELSNNIKEMNKTLNASQEQVLVNKADIQKLMDRVSELEKLHKDGKGNLVACQSTCNSDGAITKIAPVKEVKKKVVKKPDYKPANKVQVVSKSGDLSKSKPVAAKPKATTTSTNNRTLKLESVVGDRAWVRTQDGSIRSYSINDRLPNGKVIGNVDSRTGVFDVNGHLILSK